jgi:hypothetical protein
MQRVIVKTFIGPRGGSSSAFAVIAQSIVLILFFVFFRFPNIYKKEHEIEFGMNNAFFFEGIPYATTSEIFGTPKTHLIKNRKFYSVRNASKHSYICFGKGLNASVKEDISNITELEYRPRIMKARHYTILDAYGTTAGSWAIDKAAVLFNASHYKDFYWPEYYSVIFNYLVCEIDEVILTGHSHARENYGHCIHDLLAPIVLMPREVRERSYVIGSFEFSFAYIGLQHIGFRKEQILNLRRSSWFYAKKIHVINDWRPISSMSGECITKLMQVVSDNLRLDQIEAKEYGLANRVGGRGRSIGNFHELVNKIREVYPQYNWTVIVDKKASYSEVARTWAALRFVFLPTGSNVLKCLYMKKHTVLCVASSNSFDFCVNIFVVSGEHFVYWLPTGMPHYSDKPFSIDVDSVVSHFSEALYCDKNGHFRNP